LELLGQISERQVFYCNIRSDENWFDKINFDNWIAFTIADDEDKELLNDMTSHCLDKGVCYTCSAGQLASLTEDYFDEEIVWREVQESERTGKSQDYEHTPMTSFHKNFDEGFWFAVTNANQIIHDKYIKSNEVVCIDCTKNKVRGHLLNLIDKINNGWLPSDKEIEKPIYDI
jgi:hypothetical protein